MEQLVEGADVVVSCITDADGLMVGNVDLFQPGVLVVPVHTRGFQNCDRVFDKVYADDEGHVSGFRYFNEFRSFAEIGQVLKGADPGRDNDRQRILSHNIGLWGSTTFFRPEDHHIGAPLAHPCNMQKAPRRGNRRGADFA